MSQYDDYLEWLKKQGGVAPLAPNPSLIENTPEAPNPVAAAISNPGQALVRAGGSLLFNAVKTASIPGQAILGFFDQLNKTLQRDPARLSRAMDQAESAGYTGNAFGDLAKFAVGAVRGQQNDTLDIVSEAGRYTGRQINQTLSSQNLTELVDNSMSGTKLLQSLPGGIGQAFSADNLQTQIVTGGLGLALEVLLSPDAALAGAGSAVGRGVGQQLAARGATTGAKIGAKLGANALSILGGDFAGAASSIAGGTLAAQGIRTASKALVEKAAAYASNADAKYAPQMQKALSLLVGPLATASPVGRQTLMRYTALQEEMPRRLLNVADIARAELGRLGPKKSVEAQNLLSDYITQRVTDPTAAASTRDAMVKLGFRGNRIDRIGTEYFHASNRMLEALADVPDLNLRLRDDYIHNAYKVFMGEATRESHLSYLMKRNAPARIELFSGDLGESLASALGQIKPNTAGKTPIAGYATVGKSGINPLERGVPDDQVLEAANNAATAPTSASLATPAALGTEALTANLPQVIRYPATSPSNTPPLPPTNTLGDEALDALTHPSASITGKPSIVKPAFVTTNEAGQTKLRLPTPQQMDAYVSRTGSLPKLVEMDADTAKRFTSDLAGFMDGLQQQGVTSITTTRREAGRIVDLKEPEIAANVAVRKNATLKEVNEFVNDWATQNNLTADSRIALHSSVAHSMGFIPSDRTFAIQFRNAGDTSLWGSFGKNKAKLPGISTQEVAQISLPVEFHDLYGLSEQFTPRVADQAVGQGKLAAQTALYKDMLEGGMLADEPFVGSVPFPKSFKLEGFGNVTDKHIAQGDLVALQNIQKLAEDRLSKPEQIAAWASSLFKRAQLLSNPASHATQWLGNVAMLHAMGYDVFNPRNFVPQMKKALTHVTQLDGLYDEAVNAGVQVSMSALNEGERRALAEKMLVLDERAGSPQNFLEKVIDSARQALNAPTRGVDAFQAGRVLDDASKPMESFGVRPNNLGTVFSLPDRATRMYVYAAERDQALEEILASNKDWLPKQFTGQTGSLKNLKSKTLELGDLKDYIDTQERLGLAPDRVKELRENTSKLEAAWTQAKRDAADAANEAALNYHDVPGVVNYVARTGIVPFIKYPTKVGGRILEWIDEKPAVFLPYYAAQKNANATFTPDENSWDSYQAGMPQTVRDALIIPTGQADRYGRQTSVDLSSWVPFGMFSQAAGAGDNADTTTLNNSILSFPLAEMLYRITTGQDLQGNQIQRDGQSKFAFIAQELGRAFAPQYAPGSRRMTALAQALEADRFVYDKGGNPMLVAESSLGQIFQTYGNLPAIVGQRVEQALGGAQGETPTGNANFPTANRPATTPEQALTRGLIPGATTSTDRDRAYNQTVTQYQRSIDALQSQLNQTARGTAAETPAGSQARLDRIADLQKRIATVEQLRLKALERFTLGR